MTMQNFLRRNRCAKIGFALLLVLSLLLATLTGCGSSGKENGKPEGNAEISIDGELNVGGRDMLSKTYEVEGESSAETTGTASGETPEADTDMEELDDDPMNIATPEPTLPPLGTDCGAKLIAMTFDDGPTSETANFVAALNELDVDCTFFMLGQLIENYPDAVRAAVSGGHQVGSHSYDHPNLKTSSQEKVDNQLYTTERLLKEIDGKDGHYVRCPYGESGDYVKSVAPGPLIYWSVDTLDWESRNADAVYRMIVNNAYDGAIILCHDIYGSTREGALRAIKDLKSAGYEFVTVEELLKRRAIDIQNGVTYYDAQNAGTTYPDNIVRLEFGSFAEGMETAAP